MPTSACKPSHALKRLRHVARSYPLGAAILAPLVTLLDIPALTQSWFFVNGQPERGLVASIAMSAVSLAFCVIGNALLIVRFSSNVLSVRALVVEAPLVAFWIKTIVEVVNLSLYGRISTRSANHSYGQGFWCAVFSCGLSGVVAILLLFHFVIQRRQDWKDSIRIRVDGRHFMLSVLAFVSVIGIQALIFSKIEGWYFFDGVYFSIVSCLTVGFGDFAPTKTSTKILLFPFAISAIALLANQISIIVGYFTQQAEHRRDKYSAQRLLLARQGRSADSEQAWGLKEEMDFLSQMEEREHKMSKVHDMIVSTVSFLSFWVLGSVVFKFSEHWTMGDSLYFSYVTFYTIGYGDFAPTSSFGRVFFVLYSIVAVPVIASFAIQTVTAVVEQASEDRLATARRARAEHVDQGGPQSKPPAEDEVHSHAHFVQEHWSRLDRELEGRPAPPPEERRELWTDLSDEALKIACQLESQSRKMLISLMPKDSKARTLLLADRNVQRRDINAISGAAGAFGALWEQETDETSVGLDEDDLLREVRLYRELFARLLVTGARLRRLEGIERQTFLRVRSSQAAADTAAAEGGGTVDEAPDTGGAVQSGSVDVGDSEADEKSCEREG